MDSAWACRSQPSVVWGVKDGCFRRQLLQSEGGFARSRTQPGEVSFAQFKPSGWTVLNPLSLWLKSVRWPAGSDGLSAAWNDARQSVECWDFFGATGLGAVEDSLRHNHRSFNNEQCCRKSPEVVSGESWPWGRGRLYCCTAGPSAITLSLSVLICEMGTVTPAKLVFRQVRNVYELQSTVEIFRFLMVIVQFLCSLKLLIHILRI